MCLNVAMNAFTRGETGVLHAEKNAFTRQTPLLTEMNTFVLYLAADFYCMYICTYV